MGQVFLLFALELLRKTHSRSLMEGLFSDTLCSFFLFAPFRQCPGVAHSFARSLRPHFHPFVLKKYICGSKYRFSGHFADRLWFFHALVSCLFKFMDSRMSWLRVSLPSSVREWRSPFETRAKLADGGRANRLVIEKFMQIYSTLSTFWAVLPCVDGARECAQTERRQSTNRLKRAKWWPQPDQAEEGGKNWIR